MLEALSIKSGVQLLPSSGRGAATRGVGTRTTCPRRRRRRLLLLLLHTHVRTHGQTFDLQALPERLLDPFGHSSESDEEEEIEAEENLSLQAGVCGFQRYLFSVEYIGSRFNGSQWQPGRRTVVGVLQDAFQQFIGKSVSVVCSSRTDAGVHALSNVCHVDIARTSKRRPGEVLPPYDPAIVRRAVNHFLQKSEGDITITDIRYVPLDFHARFMAVERIYFYRLLTGVGPLSLFERGFVWHVPEELDVSAMQKACLVLTGLHDFSSFRGSRCQARSPVKTLDELHVSEVESSMCSTPSMWRELGSVGVTQSCIMVNDGSRSFESLDGKPVNHLEFGQRRRHRCLVIKARARSFLYHQVRLLVGVLKSVGAGDLTAKDVEKILQMRTVSAASPMAPACGLYLGHVKYNLS